MRALSPSPADARCRLLATGPSPRGRSCPWQLRSAGSGAFGGEAAADDRRLGIVGWPQRPEALGVLPRRLVCADVSLGGRERKLSPRLFGVCPRRAPEVVRVSGQRVAEIVGCRPRILRRFVGSFRTSLLRLAAFELTQTGATDPWRSFRGSVALWRRFRWSRRVLSVRWVSGGDGRGSLWRRAPRRAVVSRWRSLRVR